MNKFSRLSPLTLFLIGTLLLLTVYLSVDSRAGNEIAKPVPEVEWSQLLPSGGTFVKPASTSYSRTDFGDAVSHPPRITHVQIFDLNQDGRQQIIACDARRNRIVSYTMNSQGNWEEELLADNLNVPAHATVVDLDQDGDRDLLVSILGSMYPNDTKIGQILWLENREGRFVKHRLKANLRRVADVQPGDFDGDGDIDLAVAVFGYARGEVLWLENDGSQEFIEHSLHSAAGAIHVPVADFDGDGDLDIATVISQEDEQVIGFENDGTGQFEPHSLFESLNYDLGSAGLVADDLDQDGDMDLLLPVGDNLEYTHASPQPYHGCYWLENKGDWNFSEQRIATFGGTYAAAVGDLDGDNDRDVVLVSMTNDWSRKEHPSLIWLENDGRQNFSASAISNDPIHLITVDCGDWSGDGIDDIVTGGMNLFRPYERMGRVTGWKRN